MLHPDLPHLPQLGTVQYSDHKPSEMVETRPSDHLQGEVQGL
jgi:hypothetical protein